MKRTKSRDHKSKEGTNAVDQNGTPCFRKWECSERKKDWRSGDHPSEEEGTLRIGRRVNFDLSGAESNLIQFCVPHYMEGNNRQGKMGGL